MGISYKVIWMFKYQVNKGGGYSTDWRADIIFMLYPLVMKKYQNVALFTSYLMIFLPQLAARISGTTPDMTARKF